MGVSAGRVTGLTAPAKAMFAAASASKAPTVVVVPTDADVESMTSDARFFLAALEGLGDLEVERSVLPLPSHEVDPYRGLAPHFEIASARARALHALASGSAKLIVASAAALLPRVSAPGRLAAVARMLAPGDEISPVDLADVLAAAGYTRQDPVDESGEFCVRGGVVDFYPAGAEQPLRLEFIGDNIESIRAYDPATQRSTGALDRAAIVPLQELVPGAEEPDRGATVIDYFRSAARPAVFVSEPDEVRTHGLKLAQQIQASYDEAIAKGVPAVQPDRLVIGWNDVDEWLIGATALETLEIGGETGPSAHIASQPALEFGGRLSRLGCRDSSQPRARRHDRLHRTLRRTGRAHDRAPRRLRGLCRPHRACRGRSYGFGPGGNRPPVPRLPPPGRIAADLGRDRRFRGRAEGLRAAALGDPDVSLRFPRSEDG